MHIYVSICIYNTHMYIYLSKYTYINCYCIEDGLDETIEEAKRQIWGQGWDDGGLNWSDGSKDGDEWPI